MNNYTETWKSVLKIATETALNTAWAHWAALGGNANLSTRKEVVHIVDPEALILLSLAFREGEPRLNEMIEWWAKEGAPLTSVHRLKSILPEFGSQSSTWLTSFATMAAGAGHRSWQRHANKNEELSTNWQSIAAHSPSSEGIATLMIRMRAAFGTGVKSDVLSYLISSRDMSSTVSTIVSTIGYTKTSVRDALSEMAYSGIVHESPSRPAEYSTDKSAWNELLRIQGRNSGFVNSWHNWKDIFGFLSSIVLFIDSALSSGMNEHLIASKCRDIADHHRNAFSRMGLFVPEHSMYPGRTYAEGMLRFCITLSDWIEHDMWSNGDR